MPTPVPTLLETMETLKRSNLPTVITEGKDDYTFYRLIEDELSDLRVSLIPVGGRANLLEIYNRRRELGRNNIIFIADKDLWVYSEIPDQYIHRKMIFTDGYSIENDLYRDGEVYNFLRGSEAAKFSVELISVVEWYSYCVRRLLQSEQASISDHPNRILEENGQLVASYMQEIGYSGKDEQIYEQIMSDYGKFLRGKTLIELIVRHLSAKSRQVKFGNKQIMEIGASRKGIHLRRIVGEVASVMPAL